MISGPSKIDSLLEQLFVIIGVPTPNPAANLTSARPASADCNSSSATSTRVGLTWSSSALEPRRTRKLTDHGDRAALFRLERQHVVGVL